MQLGLHAQSIDRRQLKKQRLARSQSRNANIQMWLGAWCKGTGKPLIKSQWILFLRGFPPDVVKFSIILSAVFQQRFSFVVHQCFSVVFHQRFSMGFPIRVLHGFPPGCVHGFPPKIMLHDVPPFFFPCLWQGVSMVFHQCFSMVFHQGFCVVFQQPHFRSLPRNLNTLKWLGSVWIPFHIELHIGFHISFHQDILYHKYRATRAHLWLLQMAIKNT